MEGKNKIDYAHDMLTHTDPYMDLNGIVKSASARKQIQHKCVVTIGTYALQNMMMIAVKYDKNSHRNLITKDFGFRFIRESPIHPQIRQIQMQSATIRWRTSECLLVFFSPLLIHQFLSEH